MGDDVHGPWMPRFDFQSSPGHPFGAPILAILLETEGVDRKDTGVPALIRLPIGQYVSDPLSQHTSQTQAEVQRVGDHERDNIAWKGEYDISISFYRQGLIARKPGARRESMTTGAMIPLRAHRFDGGNAFQKFGSAGSVVAADDNGDPQAVTEDGLRVLRKYLVDVAKGIPSTSEESF
jgi:hypothetical protein